jgi:hypothetical protein
VPSPVASVSTTDALKVQAIVEAVPPSIWLSTLRVMLVSGVMSKLTVSPRRWHRQTHRSEHTSMHQSLRWDIRSM